MNGKFEFKKGNTLASLAESILINLDGLFLGSKKPQYESITGVKTFYPPSDVANISSFIFPAENYLKIIKVMCKLVPFYRYYFT